MSAECRKVRPISSHPLSSRSRVNSSSTNVAEMPAAGASIVPRATSIVISSSGSEATASRSALAVSGSTSTGSSPCLVQLFLKMSPNLLGDDGLESVVHERPDCVLRATSRRRSSAGDEDRRSCVLGLVEHEVAVVAPFGEEPRAEPGSLDALQPVRRDDLIGVDVGAVEWNGSPSDDLDGLHDGHLTQPGPRARPRSDRSSTQPWLCASARSCGVAKWPATAVAAATTGDTRWVRPPRPWRPSKFRFEVDAQRLAWSQLVGVHREAHRATGLAPFESGGDEDPVEAFGLGLVLHRPRPRYDEGTDSGRDLVPVEHGGCGSQVLDASSSCTNR